MSPYKVLRAEVQDMKNNKHNAETLNLNSQVQVLLQQRQQQEAIVKQQIESAHAMKREESKLQLQDSDCAERLKRSSEAMADLAREGNAYTIRMKEEIHDTPSEVTAAKTNDANQLVSHEKAIRSINEERQQQEKEAIRSKHEAQEESEKHKRAEVAIERQNENAAEKEVKHERILEEKAAQSKEKLNAAISQAKEDAKIIADDAQEEKLTQKRIQEAKLEAERLKTADAVKVVMIAEEKLNVEIQMKTMKGNEREKWSRAKSIHSSWKHQKYRKTKLRKTRIRQ